MFFAKLDDMIIRALTTFVYCGPFIFVIISFIAMGRLDQNPNTFTQTNKTKNLIIVQDPNSAEIQQGNEIIPSQFDTLPDLSQQE